MSNRSGLTLMELVVVLAILAALATAATVATERVIMQKRMEVTQESLTAVKDAVLGRHGGGGAQNKNLAMDGFIADLGRPPLAYGTEPDLQAGELWANPRNLEPYGWKVLEEIDPDVKLACGWRGPYLDLPVGADRLLDGWGRSYLPLMLNGAQLVTATVDQPLAGLLSLGADGEVGIAASEPLPLSEDLSVVWPLWSVNVQVSVSQRDSFGDALPPAGTGTLIVRLFGPNPTTGGLMWIGDTVQVDQSLTTIPVVSFAAVPIGPKVIRAYYYQDQEAGDPRYYRSQPLPIEVSRTGQSLWNLVLSAVPDAPAEEEEEE